MLSTAVLEIKPREIRTVMAGCRMTRAEYDRLRSAARREGVQPARVMRELALAWAGSVLEDGGRDE
jgi:hypothetical protein